MRKLWPVGIALALTSCGAAQDMSAAGEQVTAFHRAYDAGDFAALWERASPSMKKITPKPQFLDLMQTFRQRLGEVKSSTRTGFHVNYATGGSQVTLTYQTTFAQGEATETFVYDTGEPPRLIGWHFFVPDIAPPTAGAMKVEKVDRAGP